MERQQHRAVPSGRQADDRAPLAAPNRPEVAVHVTDDVPRDRRFPVSPGTPVEVLGIRIVVARALRRDDDRLPAARGERPGQEVRALIGARGRRQAVQEVHHRIPPPVAGIALRQVDRELESALDRARIDRSAQLIGLRVTLCAGGSGQRGEGRERQGCRKSAHHSDGSDLLDALTTA